MKKGKSVNKLQNTCTFKIMLFGIKTAWIEHHFVKRKMIYQAKAYGSLKKNIMVMEENRVYKCTF